MKTQCLLNSLKKNTKKTKSGRARITKEQATSRASWFLPYNNAHLYFDKVSYAYVSFSFYVTFLPFTIMPDHFFVR
jgi:hypothetical protein